ncbi:beta-glucuronosyltransferase GlcAT14A-like [Vigna umbellata]|uniref:beta-glucuronosyltransferase GlcAT14A-like n=1 Tax=Vigna umbellata TaxID=87088 RepID=UPI001F5E894F|nr:beta-glucuronosyltransferase GlcAT14A-like [Vigna umbellata]
MFIFCRSIAAENNFPSTLQCIFGCIYDLLYVFSNLSRNLNFIEHTHIAGWKLNQRARPIIIDHALYLSKKSDLALTTQRRTLPTSFKLFSGMSLSHYL